MNFRTIAKSALAVLLCGAVALPLFNLLVDPFQVFGSPEIPGFNAERPVATTRGRMAKALTVCRTQPDLALFGASRTEFLFDPDYPGLQAAAERPYNFALPGTGMDEINRVLTHAYYASGIKTAIVTLEMLGFNAYREDTIYQNIVIDFDESNLISDAHRSCADLFLSKRNTLLFSGGALRESIGTIMRQGEIDTVLYLVNGHRDEVTMGRWNLYADWPQAGIFVAQTRGYMSNVWFPPPSGRFCLENSNSSSIEKFKRIVDFSRAHGIHLIFALTPDHAFLQLAMKRAGLWPYYERWRREMVAVLAEDAREHTGAEPIPLWDFTTLNEVNAEPRPPKGVPSRDQHMRYWFEATHSRSEVGTFMVDRMFGYNRPDVKVPENFGILLTPENIESHIAMMRRDLDRYAADNPRDVEDIEMLGQGMPAREPLSSYCSIDVQGPVPSALVGLPSVRVPMFIDQAASTKYTRRGQEWLAAGRVLAARRAFDEALKVSMPSAMLYYLRGDANLRLKDFDAAQRDFTTALQLDPGNKTITYLLQSILAPAYQASGDKLRAEGKMTDAEAAYTKAIELGAPNAAFYFLRGSLRLERDHKDEAAADFEAGLKLDPDNVTLKFLLSQAKPSSPTSQ